MHKIGKTQLHTKKKNTQTVQKHGIHKIEKNTKQENKHKKNNKKHMIN
jgi:hypothetical protein